VLLSLAPEELAGFVLEYLNLLPVREQAVLSRTSFASQSMVQAYPQEKQEEIRKALIEA
jgi:hypothetical protein